MTLHKELSRAAVRNDVAAMLERVAGRVGATFQRTTTDMFPRCLTLYVRLDGAACMIHLDGDSKVGAFLGHWHFDDRRGRLFCAGFAGHGYRPHHKATTMADHAEDFAAILEGKFMSIADGSAFAAEELAGV